MPQGSLRVARLFGIDVRVHYSWLLIAGLIFFSNLEQYRLLPLVPWERVFFSLLATVLFFMSVLLHELSHSVVARRLKLPVHSITLFLFGGVSNLRKEPDSARTEFLMAIVGPLMSFVLAGAFFLARIVVLQELGGIPREAFAEVCSQLAFTNALLGGFNLLPGFPLDGGRVLRSIVWAITRKRPQATGIAVRGGQVVAGLLGLWGLYSITFPDADFSLSQFGGLWMILIAFFLFNAASASYRQERLEQSLKRLTVASLMTKDVVSVPAGLALEELVSMFVMPLRSRSFLVVDGGRPVGVVSLDEVRHVPRTEWLTRRVRDVMTPLDRAPALRPEDDARRGLEHLFRNDLAEAPVVEDGRVVGLFERDAVFEHLRMREELGLGR